MGLSEHKVDFFCEHIVEEQGLEEVENELPCLWSESVDLQE